MDAEKQSMPWFPNFENYSANGVVLKGMTNHHKRKFFWYVHRLLRDDSFLFKIGVIRFLGGV